jgi:deferrochelatase/peroxidase EfeB
MANEASVRLEIEDIQSGLIHARPSPYAATYLMFRIDDRKAGKELMRRAGTVVASAAAPGSPLGDAWATVAVTFQGLRALGVPQDSLDSFAPEFQQGMAARAGELGDTGESSPENWEKPLGTPDVHVVLAALAPDAQRLSDVLDRARRSYEKCRESK